MALLRSSLLLAALPASLVACGGGGGDSQEPPSGPHYTYVANKVLVPVDSTTTEDYGLDLDGDKVKDNALGTVLSTLATTANLNIQSTIDEAVATGDIILLVDFQTPDFSSAAGAGLEVKLGDKATAMPAPCTDPNMISTCGKHLAGTGVFTIAAGSPQGAGVVGKITGGAFNGGPGDIALQIALGGDPINLSLIGARAKATGISADALNEVLVGGAISKADLDGEVLPAVHTQLETILARKDTEAGGTVPENESCDVLDAADCGCSAGTGHFVLGFFDKMPKDCKVDLEEVKNNATLKALLDPDVVINGTEALSLGLKVTTKKAMFPTE